jgi:hypothetical protein
MAAILAPEQEKGGPSTERRQTNTVLANQRGSRSDSGPEQEKARRPKKRQTNTVRQPASGSRKRGVPFLPEPARPIR